MIKQMRTTNYQKSDIVAFWTNQHQAHAMEMFGGGESFNPDEIEKEEYIGWIKTVIDNDTYLIASISPLNGFVCLTNAADIIRKMDSNELTDDQRSTIHEFYTAPNVYMNLIDDEEKGMATNIACCHIARKAMKALFPEDVIEEVKFEDSDFIHKKCINDLYKHIDIFAGNASEQRKIELREKADELTSWFKTLRFKEYYSVRVCVKEDENTSVYYLVAIDRNLEEVSIMRNSSERTDFYNSLGPEYDLLWNAKMAFTRECFLI